jgi:hypothetical protein
LIFSTTEKILDFFSCFILAREENLQIDFANFPGQVFSMTTRQCQSEHAVFQADGLPCAVLRL